MRKKRNLQNLLLACLGAVGLASCSDFLNINPENEIVLENFWTDKNDVENVVISCYSSMQSADFMRRLSVWGELRSDNLIGGPNSANNADIANLLKENLLPTNSYANWKSFYSVINTCNTVLKYAPAIVEKDPNYTLSDWQATEAEVTTLRALCYFYLIRTFRDVPYVEEAFVSDDQNLLYPATSYQEILDRLIADLERVKDQAMKRYAKEDYNVGRITRNAVYALLADLYLWKNNYSQCEKYCNLILQAKLEALRENCTDNLEYEGKLFRGLPLILDENAATATTGNAYNQIFGTGKSQESIFELVYQSEENRLRNSLVSSFYGSNSSPTGLFAPATFIAKDGATGNEVWPKNDTRYAEFIRLNGGNYSIGKYVYRSVNTGSGSIRSVNDANWVFYRLTDILLMKAEALTEQSVLGDEENDSLLKTAFTIVQAVYCRSHILVSDSLKYTTHSGYQNMKKLVRLERQRELMFEGKRWFDLVRYALREGHTKTLVNEVKNKYSENQSAVQSKLSSMDAIFYPYSESELKVNPLLKQNPAYANTLTSYE